MILFLPFLVPNFLQGNLLTAFTMEFLALSAGCLVLWLFAGESPTLGAWTIVLSFGVIGLFAMIQFGPNMGVGVLTISWLMITAGLLDRGWLGASVIAVAYPLAGMANLQGWIGSEWYIHMSALDWARSGSLVIVVCFGTAYALTRINREIAGAWEREAAAVTENAAAERAMLQSQRLESIGKLAGGVAHDFNNSLAVLVAGIDALETAQTPDQRQELLANMKQAANGAVATTKQLLSLSRQGLEPGQPANPRQSIEALLPNLKRLLPETIQVSALLSPTPLVPLPSGELEQILLNLCLNARDAMPEGGHIEIACSVEGDQVFISVSDTGEGMDAETRDKALSPFFTTRQHGTGLGLAMVRKATEEVGGSVSLDSIPDDGTRVQLTLPAITGEAAKTGALAEVANSLASSEATANEHARTVLLVEDDPLVRDMYSEVLRLANFELQSVENVADALAAIAGNDFEILVTDAMLPDGEPSRAIKQFRAQGWKPVLVVSGYIDSDELIKDLGQSDYSFLQKPFPNKVLVSTVEGLLRGEVLNPSA
ncbi:MAG: ATP-binding protein [Halieaceae bacterium]